MAGADQGSSEVHSGTSRTERRKIQTRKKLIEAMYRLTASRGVEAVTVQEIVDEADIAKGSFYNYFADKDALLEEVVREVIFARAESIDQTIAAYDDPLRTIAMAFATFDRIIASDTVLGWFLVNVREWKPDIALTLRDRLLRDVEAGIASQVFAVPNLEMAINFVGVSLFEFYRNRLLGKIEDRELGDFIRYALRILGADDEAARAVAEDVCRVTFGGDLETV